MRNLDHHNGHDRDVVEPIASNSTKSHVGSALIDRKTLYEKSLRDPSAFWADAATAYHWEKPWPAGKSVLDYNFHRSKGGIFVKWFGGAQTNMCYNALDRHMPRLKDRVCYHWEGNAEDEGKDVTYGEMYDVVLRLAAVLKHRYGVRKGDVVTLYLPMVPFGAQAMLAAARLGAIVSVIFAGFSAQAVANRLLDAKSKLIITVEGFFRGPKPLPLKKITDEALALCAAEGHNVRCIVCERHQRENVPMTEGRDAWFDDVAATLTASEAADRPIVWTEAEDPLFLLYTSGSTGKPKAIVHTVGGYMVYAGFTFKHSFDYHDGDVFFCTADIGWITGHTYAVYGPMLNGATSVLFEGMPTYPSPSRWWKLVDKYRVSIFYTAPTAIRALMQCGEEHVQSTSRETLRVLGSVGEPINPEAWRWFYDVIGRRHADIVDTWWQTETGGHIITPLPGCTPMKPGSATLPFFGIVPELLDSTTREVITGKGEGVLVIRNPWPGIARTIWGDHARYEQTYFSIDGFYVTGDGARRDADGYYWITGRLDDVLNVSGHRIGTREVEDAVSTHPDVVESAAVGIPHDLKGECIYIFVVFNNGVTIDAALLKSVSETVRRVIGPFAAPDYVQPAQCGLPKNRSGKMLRRLLRKIASGMHDDLGDTTTLVDHSIVPMLIEGRAQTIKK